MEQPHARWRNAYRVPEINPGIRFRNRTSIWNGHHRRLIEVTSTLRAQIRAIEFLERWLMPAGFGRRTRVVRRGDQSDSLSINAEDEIALLQDCSDGNEGVLGILLDVQRAHARYMMGLHPPPLPLPEARLDPLREPQMLLRAFSLDRSHTYYCQELGFRSSGYWKCPPAAHFDELIRVEVLTERSLRVHCEGILEPSNWISMANDPKWLLNLLNQDDQDQDEQRRVAFVSTAKLNRLAVLYDRSDTLARRANIPTYSWTDETGVRFTWSGHWLAHAWIPAQCIERVVTLQRFRELCHEYSVTGSKYGLGLLQILLS